MSAVDTKSSAKAAHVNLMVDTIIANLPTDALRSIMRGLLGVDPRNTLEFQRLVGVYLKESTPAQVPNFFTKEIVDGEIREVALSEFYEWQSRYRCLMGGGFGFQTLESLTAVIKQATNNSFASSLERTDIANILAILDSDLVQALTAVQKELSTSVGQRQMTKEEIPIIETLRISLGNYEREAQVPLQRGTTRLEKLFAPHAALENSSSQTKPRQYAYNAKGRGASRGTVLETAQLGPSPVPRMFMGLWQFSSPAWGSAPRAKIDEHFRKHVDAGLIAYDMADHYGDAEVTFGSFRCSQPDSNNIYCATKWCVFEPIKITSEVVKAAVTERLSNLNAERLELLQLHWQDYSNNEYIDAAKFIAYDERVDSLGLCNFDAEHMDEIIESGTRVVSNQVQFSLIDLRPTFKMAASCKKYDVKLLTYGSLCGGLLADKWLGKAAPNLFDEEMTPSSRKYLEMINVWGGWALFQELLSTLAKIGKKHSVSVSTVAVRWVLDHEYVGAIIVGARMGISEHVEENLKAFGFRLDNEDQAVISNVLDKCRAREVFDEMGDCGAEYR